MDSGFYKIIDGSLIYAMNYVKSHNYEICADRKNEYKYPVDGWYWFENLESATKFFNIDV